MTCPRPIDGAPTLPASRALPHLLATGRSWPGPAAGGAGSSASAAPVAA